ncbi:unnamed protein product [Dicrocoelium dendriticum]|nr:unnamed protein product [Dicrocoelium dendriticum]
MHSLFLALSISLQAFPSILNLLTLLPPDSPSSIGREEPNTESDGFPLTTPSTSLSTEAGHLDLAAETPVDQTEQRPVDNKCAVLVTECPSKSPPSVGEEAKLGDKNDVNQVDVDVAAEKRRSSRSRSVVDLTDGLNRYRAKRTWFMDDEAKPAPPNKGSKPARVETLDRFRLSVKLLSLLPKVFQ